MDKDYIVCGWLQLVYCACCNAFHIAATFIHVFLNQSDCSTESRNTETVVCAWSGSSESVPTVEWLCHNSVEFVGAKALDQATGKLELQLIISEELNCPAILYRLPLIWHCRACPSLCILAEVKFASRNWISLKLKLIGCSGDSQAQWKW